MSESAEKKQKAELESRVPANPHRASWQQTMLRCKDPKASVPFYEQTFGMTLVDKYTFDSFSLYFLALLPDGVNTPEPGTDEAHQWLWNTDLTVLELTHNHGTEDQEDFKHNNGNVEPHRGFGHIAFATDDVYAACEEMEKQGVKFQKKPDEGRMKGLAFALDPDGYWIEIISRLAPHDITTKYNLAQTMMRVKDPKKSVEFYQKHFGMTLINQRDFESAKFSLYFLATLPPDTLLPPATSPESREYMKRMFNPVLELTHNHGTEDDPNFSYHNGNTEPRGFGHIGFLVDDVNKATDSMIEAGVEFQKKPNDGTMKGIAFARDPDGYWVEIVPRGITF